MSSENDSAVNDVSNFTITISQQPTPQPIPIKIEVDYKCSICQAPVKVNGLDITRSCACPADTKVIALLKSTLVRVRPSPNGSM